MSATLATFHGAMQDAFARRAAFWSQVAIMVLNDLAWIGFWTIFFDRVGTVRGWDVDAILMLYATFTIAAGLVLGVLANARHLARLIDEGAIDHVLTLPVSPLLHLLVRRIDAVHTGDIVFGVVLFAVIGDLSPERVGAFVFAVACSTIVLAGFVLTAASSVFFTGRSQGGDLSVHSIMLLASYPAEIFTGYTKALLFTIVPAAFVSTVPSRLVTEFSWTAAAALATAAAAFALIGWTVFHTGLRRYTSGSGWTRA
ncbi:MAG TPA: ABC-2 family transporter protein [Acidimicrobiales bacterium]|nr:ABC-2 family transporter protein [Acidimicrobiales bacterium]